MPISLDGTLGINSSGNVTAPYYFGNGRFLTGINGSGGNGSAISSGNSSISFDGNGNAIININGANVASFTPDGLTVANGNIIADGFFFANGAPVAVDLGNITTNLIPSLDLTYTLGNSTNQWKDLWVGGNTIYMYQIPINLASVAFANGIVGNTLAVGGNPLIASNTNGKLGNLEVSGNATANAFLSDSYLWANGTPVITADGNLAIGNISATGTITAAGNVAGGNLTTTGNVSGSNVNASNAVVAVGNVSGGNITTIGKVVAVGNVSGGNITTTGNVDANSVSANTVAALTVTTGNVIATDIYTNVITSNTANIVGTLQAGNLATTGSLTATGNVVGGNIVTQGDVVAGGNVTVTGNVNTDYVVGYAVTIQSTGSGQGVNLVPGANGNINVNSTYINNLAMPLQPNDAANKYYVDLVAANLRPTLSVTVATAAALNPYTYNNGTAGVGATITLNAVAPLYVEGQLVALNNRVLVKDETGSNTPYNGIYVCTTQGTPSVAAVLTRADDFDEPVEVTSTYTFDENSNSGWVCLTPSIPAIVFGTTDIIWTQFSEAGAYQPGAGLTLAGQIFNVNPDNDTIYVNGSNKVAVKPGANLPNVSIQSANITGSLNVEGNTTLANLTATGTTTVNNLVSNAITTTGNLTSGNLVTSGTTYTNAIISNSTVTNGNTTTTGTTTSGNTVTIGTTTSDVVIANTTNTTGTTTSGNIVSLGNTTTAGNATSGNVISLGDTTTTGTTTSGNTVTIGTTTTNAIVSNTSTTTGNATSGNVISLGNTTTAGTTTTNALISNTTTTSGNSTSGNVISLGNTTTTGTTTSGNTVTIGTTTTNVLESNTTVTTGNTTSGNITSLGDTTTVGTTTTNALVSNTTTTSGNTTTGNLLSNGTVSSSTLSTTGNADIGGNLTSANFSTTGNANIGNLYVPGTTTLIGNAVAGNLALTAIYTDGYFFANGVPFVSGGGGNGVVIGDQQIVGNGNTAYGLTQAATTTSVIVVVNGVTQYPVTAYNVAGNTITFAGPISNASIVDIRYFAASGGNVDIYGDANVALFLPTYTGNLGTANTTPVGAIFTDGYYYANGTPFVGGGTGNYGNSNVTTLLASGNVTSNIITTANVTAQNFIGNGSQLTGMYGNANVELLLEAGIANNIVTTANVTAQNFIGNGSQLTGMYGDANVEVLLETGIANNIVTTGNVTANVYFGNGSQLTGMYGNANVEVLLENGIANNIITTGNVTANVYFGNGSQLTGMYGNANVSNYLASGTNTANIITTGNIDAANFITLGSVTVGANVDANNVNTTAQVNAAGNITGGNITTAGIANVGNLVVKGTSNLIGNTQASNIAASGAIVATKNIQGANFITSGQAQVTGNVNAGNVNTDDIYGSTVTITATVGGIVFKSAGDINAGNTLIHNVVDPLAAQDAATKYYVDGVAQGLSVKQSVTTATTTALPPYTYNNGVLGVGATITAAAPGALDVDGTGNTLLVNDRILIKNESAANTPYNGVYVATDIGNVSAPFILTRSTDMDLASEFPAAFIFVVDGNVNQSSGWTCTNQANTVTVGTTPITFSQFSYAGGYSAGNGMILSGTQFSVNIDPETMAINGSNEVGVKANANLVSPNIGNATFQSLTSFAGGTGNISANNISLSGVAEVTGNVIAGNINTAQVVANANITTSQNIIASGNVSANNVNATDIIATGNITGGNILSVNAIYASDTVTTGNTTTGNLLVTNNLVTSGNITANNLVATNSISSTTANVSDMINTGNITVANVLTAPTANLTDITASNITATTANVVTIAANTYYYGGNGLPVVFYTNSNVADFLASGNLTTDIITTANVTAQNFVGNGAALTGMYGNANVELLLETGIANNIITTANVTAQNFIGNGSQLTDMYGNANVIVLLETGIANNIITTGNTSAGNSVVIGNIEVGGLLTDNYYYANGTPVIFSNYGNANVELLLSSNNITGNILTTGNISGTYILGNGAFLTGIPPGYTDANVTTLLASGNVTSNIITTANVISNVVTANILTVNTKSNLGNPANIVITGGSAGYSLMTDGSGNLSWGIVSPAAIPSVYFTANVAGNNQQFSNVVLSGYVNAEDINLFYNGALLENQYYTLAGDTITVNTDLDIGDTIDIARQVAGNIINVSSGYGDSNVLSLLSSGVTTNINIDGVVIATAFVGDGSQLTGLPAGYTNTNVTDLLESGNVSNNIITTGNISSAYFIGNGSQLTGLPAGYADSNVTTLLSSGNVTSNVITTGNIAGNYYTGNGRFLTGMQTVSQIPAVHFTAIANGNAQTFSNVVLGGYTANTDMTIFMNGVLLENSYYTLAGDVLTINTYLRTNDNIDVITQLAGNINNVTSGYGNSNVGAYLNSYTGNVSASNVIVTNLFYMIPTTFAALPSAVTAGAGAKAFITDSDVNTYYAIVSGSGANGTPVFSDGTDWRVG